MAGFWDLLDKLKQGAGNVVAQIDDAIIPDMGRGKATLSGSFQRDLRKVGNAAVNTSVGRNVVTPIVTAAAQPALGVASLFNPKAGAFAKDQYQAVQNNATFGNVTLPNQIPVVGGTKVNPLMMAGEIAANPLTYIPVAKGLSLAQRVTALGGLGAVEGLTAPATSIQERAGNTAFSGLTGGLLPMGGLFAGKSAQLFPNASGKFSPRFNPKIRFEIPDNNSRFLGELKENVTRKLGEVFEHPELYANYPDFANIRIKMAKLKGSLAEWDERTRQLTLSPQVARDPHTARQAILHELQHAVQQREGFAPGGMPATPKNFLQRIGLDQTPNQNYRRLAGEMEAFDVMERADLTPDQRLRQAPYSSQKINLDDVIVNSRGRSTISGMADQPLHPDWNTPKGKRAAQTMRELEANLQNLGNLNAPQSVGEVLQQRGKRLLPWEGADASLASTERRLSPEDIAKATKNAMAERAAKDIRGGTDLAKIAEDIRNNRGIPQVDKITALDYLRTPDRVLKKLGMERHADALKKAELEYQKELPNNIQKIRDWMARAKQPDAEARIFRWLDGNKREQLLPSELEVAKEIQGWLKEWADRLNLPAHRRVSDYITHIFDKDFAGSKEFPDEFARLIEDKVAGSVYNPFTEARIGKKGYIEDVWLSLDSYAKRATRAAHMDPVLSDVKLAAGKLDLASEKFIKRYTDRINMRPTEYDTLIDNFIKGLPGGTRFGQRPVAAISRGVRTAIYRGTLGGNLMSPLKNLTQGINTYSELGEKYTAIGYTKMFKDLLSGGDELTRMGVLANDQIDARTLSAGKQFTQGMDKALFSLFDLAERINRGAAYFGTKSRALAKGASEEEAVNQALEMVRKTQFVFGNVNTPVAMQSDLVKLFTQFQSYNLKQTEFIAEMLKNKEGRKMLRFLGATLAVTAGAGKFLGMEPKDFVPVIGLITGDSRVGSTPFFEALGGAANVAFAGDDEQQRKQGLNDLTNAGVAMIPAGVQIKKSLTGLSDFSQGEATTSNDRQKYAIEQNPQNLLVSGLFGSNRTPEGTRYRYNQEPQVDLSGVFADPSSSTLSATQRSLIEQQIKDLDKLEQATLKKSETGFLGLGATPAEEKNRELAKIASQRDGLKQQLKVAAYTDQITELMDGSATGLGRYLNNQDRLSLGKKILKETFSGDMDDQTAYDLLSRLELDPTELERQMVISLPDVEQAQYVFDALDAGSDPIGLISSKILTSNVVSKMLDQGLIDAETAKVMKGAIKELDSTKTATAAKSRKGRKITAPKSGKTRFGIAGMASSVFQTKRNPLVGLPEIKLPELKLSI